MPILKKVFKQSIFGALFTLWTAPIDEYKLDISQVKKPKNSSFFLNNLIVGHKG